VTLVVVGSARGAPGATTLALAITAWLEDAVLVEADPDGGVLAIRHGLGREPGLVTLAAGQPSAGETLLDHAQRLPGGLPVVVAPESAERATHLWGTAGPALVRMLSAVHDVPVVVDIGRLGPASPARALLPTASLVVVVARPTADQLLAATDRTRAVSGVNDQVAIALVGEGPYSASDVSGELGCEVLGAIATDARAAGALAGSGTIRHLARSALLRSARGLAEEIARRCGVPAAATTRTDGAPLEGARR
jgi:hypothetical protein